MGKGFIPRATGVATAVWLMVSTTRATDLQDNLAFRLAVKAESGPVAGVNSLGQMAFTQ